MGSRYRFPPRRDGPRRLGPILHQRLPPTSRPEEASKGTQPQLTGDCKPRKRDPGRDPYCCIKSTTCVSPNRARRGAPAAAFGRCAIPPPVRRGSEGLAGGRPHSPEWPAGPPPAWAQAAVAKKESSVDSGCAESPRRASGSRSAHPIVAAASPSQEGPCCTKPLPACFRMANFMSVGALSAGWPGAMIGLASASMRHGCSMAAGTPKRHAARAGRTRPDLRDPPVETRRGGTGRPR